MGGVINTSELKLIVSTTTQKSVFTLLKVIKKHKEKRPEDRMELTKLKTIIFLFVSLNRK